MNFLKSALALATILALSGCDQQQYENAVDDWQEETAELDNLMTDVVEDDVVTEDEAEDILDQREEVREATGELAEQKGDLIESKLD